MVSETPDREQITMQVAAQIDPHIVAVGVSEADYMEHYAETHHERVQGVIYTMPPMHTTHYFIIRWLAGMLEEYLNVTELGEIREDAFVMRLPKLDIQRQPDIQVILQDKLDNLKPTYMDGPADICIEVISPGSIRRDRGDKFVEYEQAGVGEYWIIDAIRGEALFYRLISASYQQQRLNDTRHYETPLLPKFKLHVPTLWQSKFPSASGIAEAIKTMLAE